MLPPQNCYFSILIGLTLFGHYIKNLVGNVVTRMKIRYFFGRVEF